MQQEKKYDVINPPPWWFDDKFVRLVTGQDFSEIWDIPALLQKHTERIIKEIEGMKSSLTTNDSSEYQIAQEVAFNAALDAVINHLKKV